MLQLPPVNCGLQFVVFTPETAAAPPPLHLDGLHPKAPATSF